MYDMAIVHLLELLREKTDEQHRMTQHELTALMQKRHGYQLHRRNMKRYLSELQEGGYPLNATEKPRVKPDGSIEMMTSDWYIESLFDVSESRLLHDLLMAMPGIPESQRDALMQKLDTLSSPTYRETQAETKITYLNRPVQPQLFYTVDILCEAIRTNCKVQFRYGSYVLDDKHNLVMKPRTRDTGVERNYVISPYEIVVSHGRYYLVGCKEPYTTLSNYRIDRIMDIMLIDEPRLPMDELAPADPHPQHVADQLYMYSGEPVSCKFLSDAGILNDVVDWFGTDVAVEKAANGQLLVTVSVHPVAMQHWAMQYGNSVTVLEPASLRESIADSIRRLKGKYEVL